MIHHISTIKKEHREIMFQQSLDYIWKITHCHSIRLNLYHIKKEGTAQHADKELKELLKAFRFRWKQIRNEGLRYEIHELLN